MKVSAGASRTSRKQFSRQWAWRDRMRQFGCEHSYEQNDRSTSYFSPFKASERFGWLTVPAAGLTNIVEHIRQKSVWQALHLKCSHSPGTLAIKRQRESAKAVLENEDYNWKTCWQSSLGQTIIVERKYCLAWTSGFSGSSCSSQVRYSSHVRVVCSRFH